MSEAPLKLMYLTDTLYNSGGMERVLTEKVNWLSARTGYDVTVVTNHQKGRKPFYPLDASVKVEDVNVNTHIPFLRPLYRRRVYNLIERCRPDICVALNSSGLRALALKESLPCVRMSEFHFSFESFIIRGKESQLERMKKDVGRLDRFVTLTREDAEKWKKYAPRIAQIYNPLTFEREAQAPLEEKRCICVGRFVPQKNYADLLTAWKSVSERHPDWKLDLYGEGPLEAGVRKLVQMLGLDGSVAVNRPTNEIRSKMAHSSILLMTSIYEGFPMVLLESASIGLPSVVYDCPCGPSEMIEDGITGNVVKVGDTAAFASKVCEIIENEELRRRMGKAAYNRAALFEKKEIMKQWDELFRKEVERIKLDR